MPARAVCSSRGERVHEPNIVHMVECAMGLKRARDYKRLRKQYFIFMGTVDKKNKTIIKKKNLVDRYKKHTLI
jgi:hypothetical protein